ncbi:hypothetical protein KGY14_04035 [Ameyamaea chiangmaiensis]|uniref:DUF1134 domain-containing protein n=1 Tax=Ameyamaea chiangmaiensis TaxID=442969 RepID=A0A850PAQ1_9PROT|nr:hypothetical protein [Ameyamaea chiangmaiensis]MBS4074358.1 hypothetical protein [Ameyamaea chiangmaiensis]NVN41028.1 hypothetical protein [Ameyamaea chiangmaiensis]
MKFSTIAAATLMTVATAAPLGMSARAEDALGTPAGKVTLTVKSADVGVGYTWGEGTLRYGHHTYHFTVKGGTIAAVGYSKVIGTGTVYNLSHLRDFDGTYAAVNGEATAGDGLGGQVLKNGNGVAIKIETVSKGARLAAAAQGIELTIKN